MLIHEQTSSTRAGGMNVYKGNKTATILILLIVLSLFCVSTAYAANPGNNPTATPTADPSMTPTPTVTASPSATATPTASPTPSVSATPTASASPTAVPTPGPRQVFSAPRWDTDHVTITVTNNGDPITVTAWINDQSKKATISVGAGETMAVSTPSIQAQNGQIVSFGFNADQNGTAIDTYGATVTVGQSSTATTAPPAETVTISGLVVDADNGTPISGATVTFRSLTYDKTYPPVITGSDGSYSSPKVYADVYTITVTGSGYQPASLTTNGKITADAMVSPVQLKKLGGGTPSSTPIPTPTPTPNLFDSWVSILYSPTICLGSISALIAIIAGSIGIYEWMLRKRKEGDGKGGDKSEGPKPPKM